MEQKSETQKNTNRARRALTVGLIAGAAIGVGADQFTHAVEDSKVIDSSSIVINSGDLPGDDIYNAVEFQLKQKGIDQGVISHEDAAQATDALTDVSGNVQPGPVKIQITENGLGAFGVHVHTDSERLANTN